MFHQLLTLTLDGMTAGDYLARVADPEPPTLGTSLASITVRGDPLGSTLGIALAWNVSPPTVVRAVTIAGFPLVPEVVCVEPAAATDIALSLPSKRSTEPGEVASPARQGADVTCRSTPDRVFMGAA